MNRIELKKLYENISLCACVNKGDSDEKEVFLNFKVICGKNLDLIQNLFDQWNEHCSEEAKHTIDDLYEEYYERKAKGEEFDESKYADAIKSFERYESWFNSFMEEEIDDLPYQMFPFLDIPEKISGGYILSIAPMIEDFPSYD